MRDSSDKERMAVMVNCLGLRETARLLGKDPGNLHRTINGKKRVCEAAEENKSINTTNQEN